MEPRATDGEIQLGEVSADAYRKAVDKNEKVDHPMTDKTCQSASISAFINHRTDMAGWGKKERMWETNLPRKLDLGLTLKPAQGLDLVTTKTAVG